VAAVAGYNSAAWDMEKHTDTACKASEVIARDDYSGFCIGRMVELIEPIFILQYAAKHPLVIAKEYKGNEAAAGNTCSEALSSAKRECHCFEQETRDEQRLYLELVEL